MTLTDTNIKLSYNGDGSTTAFPVTFVFWNANDLRVILRESDGTETVWTRGTHYTVTGGGGSTGTVNVSTSPTDYTPASGQKLIIKSNLPYQQDTSLPLGGAFPSTSVEQQFDKIVRQVQQKSEELDRTLKFSETSPDSGVTFPDITGNGDKFFRINSDGTAIDTSDIVSLGDVSLSDSTPQESAPSGSAGTANAVSRDDHVHPLPIASQAEAEAGTDNTKVMTPLRTKQAVDELAHGWPASEVTIASGAITPTGVSHTVDTESDAASDDLDTVTTTNMTDGDLLLLTAENVARVVTVKHGTDNIDLANDEDFELDDAQKAILLQLRSSTLYEVLRTPGSSTQLTVETAQSTSSGTTKDFTSLPNSINLITIIFSSVSLDGTGDLLVQIGDSGGLETSGYVSTSASIAGAGNDVATSTSGFIFNITGGASTTVSGTMTLCRVSGTTWISSHAGRDVTNRALSGGGDKTLSGTLDRVRVTLTAGNFDAGNVNIFYQ